MPRPAYIITTQPACVESMKLAVGKHDLHGSRMILCIHMLGLARSQRMSCSVVDLRDVIRHRVSSFFFGDRREEQIDGRTLFDLSKS